MNLAKYRINSRLHQSKSDVIIVRFQTQLRKQPDEN